MLLDVVVSLHCLLLYAFVRLGCMFALTTLETFVGTDGIVCTVEIAQQTFLYLHLLAPLATGCKRQSGPYKFNQRCNILLNTTIFLPVKVPN